MKKNRFVCRVVLQAFLAVVCVLAISAPAPLGFAQAAAKKKVVKTQADLPRFNYKLDGTATDLLQSSDATFGAFAVRVKADVGSVLANYDVQDHAALRELLGVHLDLQLLAGDNEGALETVQKLRAVEDKPDAKMMTGLSVRAMVEAQKATGRTSGPEYLQAFQKAYAAEIKPLPWSRIRPGIFFMSRIKP